MILPFLKRRWWHTQNRILTTISIALLVPVILYISVVSVMNNVIVRSIDGIEYEHWVFPGLVMIVGIFGLFPLLYRDLFDLRIHRRILQPITLAPLSKIEIMAGIVITAVIESLSYAIIGLIVLSILIPVNFTILNYLAIILYLLIFNLVMSNVFITVGLLTDRVTTYMFIILGCLIFFLFGSGILVEFEFYPALLSTLFSNLPTSVLMQGLRSILFSGRFDLISIIYPFILMVAWLGLNSFLFKVKSKQ